MAAPTIRSNSTNKVAATSCPVNKPTGLAVGDLMVAWQVTDNDSSGTNAMSGPSGWPVLGAQAGQPSPGPSFLKIYYRIATSTETAATSFAFATTDTTVDHAAGILAITAGTFDPTTPFVSQGASNVVFGYSATGTTSHVAPSATGVVDGLLLCAFTYDPNGQGTGSYTQVAGMTEQFDIPNTTSTWVELAVDSVALTSAGATGNKTATAGASRGYNTASLVVAPAPAAVNPTRFMPFFR
jgi:hypothetical protein